MRRTLISLAVVLGTLILLAIGGCGYAYKKITHEPWAQKDAWIYLHKEASPDEVLSELRATGGDTSSLWFGLACRLYKLQEHIARNSSGAYLIKEGMTASQVIRKISLRMQDPIKLTFIGTRTLPELAGKLSHSIEADSAQILNAIYAPEFLQECGCDSANVSSIFLPDTYEVYWTITPEKLAQKMLVEYKKFWNEERMNQANSLHLTPWQVSTICSIAEEETANRQERGVVARLYWNRYNIGMPLQADPTVKYATGDFALRRILNKHLAVQSPYNTYLHEGLPPGPIRVVEKATIDAFLQSKPHKFLFMCAKEDFTGLHNFATNLTAHNLNAARYHKALSAHGIR